MSNSLFAPWMFAWWCAAALLGCYIVDNYVLNVAGSVSLLVVMLTGIVVPLMWESRAKRARRIKDRGSKLSA